MDAFMSCALWCKVTSVVGAVYMAYWGLKWAVWLYTNFVASVNLKKRYAKAGTWAVVTGASDGIGRAFAIDLAKRGFNVCIIARTLKKVAEDGSVKGLAEVQDKIKSLKPSAEVKMIEFDFAKAGDAEYTKLFKELDTLDLAVMVNNVGINYEHPLEFETVDIAEDLKILKVNCEAQMRMSKYAAQKLKPKRAGAIVSLSSMFGSYGAPLLAPYGGTKAFNAGFSDSLAYELGPHGIDVMTVAPGMVCSNMSKKKRPTFDCPTAAQYAYQTLNKLGLVQWTNGHRHHDIMGGVAALLSPSFIGSQLYKINKGVMKRALKKKEAAAAKP